MTARDRLVRVRRVLVAGSLVSAILWGTGAGFGVLLLAGILDGTVGLPIGVGPDILDVAIVAGLGVLAGRAWRAGKSRRLEQVALWVEERVPSLHYTLVTSLDPAGQPYADRLDRQAAAIRFESPAWTAARKALLTPGIALVAVLGMLAVLPGGVVARVAAGTRSGGTDGGTGTDALASLRVDVDPPSYTGLPSQTLDDPANVAAVTGSVIRISGRATSSPVTAAAESLGVTVGQENDRWTASLTMPERPTIVRFRHASRERLLLLDPRADSLPRVLLELPARDTVFREPSGALPAAVSLSDDFGLTAAWWEVVISSGEGESFKFRTLELGRASLGNARSGRRALTLRLDSLALAPGDLVHLRAVAQDDNVVTGPGIAGSDTRTIRIARAGEYDSLSIEALPPADALNGVLSQRMLILLTEALDRKKPKLARPELLSESGRIARDQNALRRQIGNIIFSRLEDLGGGEGEEHGGEAPRPDLTPEQLLAAADSATQGAADEALDFASGESPVIAINRPLLEAYNAMWDAGRELAAGETRRALPHMYAALAAIQRARLAERIYLRGQAQAPVVDLAKVRLAGKREGTAPLRRSPGPAVDPELDRQVARFDRALDALGAARASAIDSLLLLRADLLTARAAAAAPLGSAIDALREGRDATDLLVRAYRALQEGSSAREGLSRWGQWP